MKNRLKVLRAERNWTQAQLAVELEVTRQTINAIETLKYDPSLPLALQDCPAVRATHRRHLLRH
jgi:putative transcriptional regulator